MDLLRRYRLTALTLGLAATSVVLGVLLLFDNDTDTAADAMFAIVVGVSGLALVGGLSLHRARKVDPAVCNGFVVVGIAMAIATYWWLFLVPVLVGAAIVWFGVVKNGLEAELRPS